METWLKYLVAATCAVVIVGVASSALRGREARMEAERNQRFAEESRVCLEEFEAGIASRRPAASFYECFRTGRIDQATANRVLVKYGFDPLDL